jgi:hypothetical protein
MLTKVIWILLLMLASSVVCHCSQLVSVSPVPALPATTRGQTVTIQGENFPASGVKAVLRTGKEREGNKGVILDATVANDGKSLSFKLPEGHFDTGRYLVFLDFDSTELAVPGDLTVLPDQLAKIQIDSISPPTAYASNKERGYDFDISGTNLGQAPNDNILEVVGAGPQPVGTPEECSTYASSHPPIYQKTCLSYEPGMETRKLSVRGFHPAHYEGPVDFRLRVNGNVSETKRVTFSQITETSLKLLATVVSVILGAIVLGLVWKGIGVYRIAGEDYSPAASFFLDKQTNSYSLSKFQLLAWTGVAVFSYIFVLFCRILIQWDFTFPAIPSGWPTLLGLSAGATVAAVGITLNRGPKGAGPTSPSIADFISSGGLVASDRFQFFVWTLVGCAGFIALVLFHDPSTLKDLPDVPAGFLYLMGISATGYLAGKLVRLPGPVVAELFVTSAVPRGAGTPASLTIMIKGENLSKDALVKVDADTLRPDQFSIDMVKAQDQAPDPSFCSVVNLTLKDADAFLQGVHNLVLTNKDGQMAASSFPIDPLTIEPGQSFKADTRPLTVDVKGKHFADGMTAEWTNEADNNTQSIATNSIQKTSDTTLKITLTPGPQGKGTLVLISAINLRAIASVTVT